MSSIIFFLELFLLAKGLIVTGCYTYDHGRIGLLEHYPRWSSLAATCSFVSLASLVFWPGPCIPRLGIWYFEVFGLIDLLFGPEVSEPVYLETAPVLVWFLLCPCCGAPVPSSASSSPSLSLPGSAISSGSSSSSS